MKILSFYYARKTHPINHSLTYSVDFTTHTLTKSHDDSIVCINLTSLQEEHLLEELKLCEFDSWKSTYMNRFRKDGFHWEIHIKFEEKTLSFSGNETPNKWNHIQNILKYSQNLTLE